MNSTSLIEESKVLANPAPALAIEIYKQKYENFRHFDRLRWAVVPLVFGAAGLFSIARDVQGLPTWWATGLFGLFAVICAWSLRRFNVGIEANRRALAAVAVMLGDNSVPGSAPKFGASTVIAGIIFAIGAGAIATSFARCPWF